MKKTIRGLVLVICATLLMVPHGVLSEEGDAGVYRLGTSCFTMEIPEGMEEGELPEEAAAGGMVAYLYDLDAGLFVDVFQYSREEFPGTLAEFVEQEAAKDGGTEIVPIGEINGFPAGWFTIPGLTEDPEGSTFCLVLEDEANFAEIRFFGSSAAASDEIQAILESFRYFAAP